MDVARKVKSDGKIKNILFDFGGVLATSEQNTTLDFTSLQNYLGKLRKDFSKEHLHNVVVVGNANYNIYRANAHIEIVPASKRIAEFYIPGLELNNRQAETAMTLIAETLDRLEVRADAHAVLGELRGKGYRLGLVSNTMGGNVKRLMRKSGLSTYMETEVYSSDLGSRKPSIEIFRAALENMRARAEESAYVGDTLEKDVMGAHAAGFRVKIIFSDAPVTHALIDYRINSLSQLIGIM